MKLPKIYEHFELGQVFSTSEAGRALELGGHSIRKKLSELCSRGHVVHVRQGVYCLCEPNSFGRNMEISPLVVGSLLGDYCYIGFRSALEFYATNAKHHTIYVVSKSKFNLFQFRGINFQWCQNPEPIGLRTELIHVGQKEYPILITNIEKTIVDCLKRPSLSPDFSKLIALCDRLPQKPQPQKLLQYAYDKNVAAILNRLGFLMDSFQKNWNIPEDLLSELQSKISSKKIPITFSSSWEDILKNRGINLQHLSQKWNIFQEEISFPSSLEKNEKIFQKELDIL